MKTSNSVTAHRATLLGDILTLEYGSPLPKDMRTDGLFPVYGSNGPVGSHNEAKVAGPGIIVGRKGSIGKVAYSEANFWPIDTTYYVKTDQDIKYIYYLLDALGLAKMNRSTGIPGLNREDVYGVAVFLPPIDEQRRIAEILNSADLASATTYSVIEGASNLKYSLMKRTINKSGTRKMIGEIAKIKSGGTPSRSVKEYWEGGMIPWVRTGEVDYAVIQMTEEVITQAGLDNSAAQIFPKGTILLAMYGQGTTRGKVAVLGIDAATNQACAAILITDKSVIPKYLYYCLSSMYEELREVAHGANQKNLSAEIIRQQSVLIPDISSQQRHIRAFEALDMKIEAEKASEKRHKQLKNALVYNLIGYEEDAPR